ncbi:flagellar biosynthesis protein [Candidatus Hydrogenisulfobacillus filiaventi]|uniref:Flagellar biosynthesis protein n=1 Tax=Candidatus Hydrogenisulfobacillus filiaventi TaxID=2707344 RepID=A0A6F8ZEF4_9FIRM|nr:flagellar biosynthetic protein FliQ [Bacillota bacterium]CAB1128023.1 flagellar biosynthesis protein [Candidatus Hydrogenisulfobacillus filiaventi]
MLDQALALSQEAMVTAGVVILPLLLAALLVGLLVGLFQATTQIQELTLSFLPKLIAMGIILYLAGPWFLRVLVGFAAHDLGGFWRVAYLP